MNQTGMSFTGINSPPPSMKGIMLNGYNTNATSIDVTALTKKATDCATFDTYTCCLFLLSFVHLFFFFGFFFVFGLHTTIMMLINTKKASASIFNPAILKVF